jgi:uncharacterized protein
LKLSLVPREIRFYDLFERQAALVREALGELGAGLSEGTSHHARLRELEHECDSVTREIYTLTNVTFTTPIAPADILDLARSLDDVVDLAEEAADMIDLYKAAPIPEPARRLGECITLAGVEIDEVVERMRTGEELAPALQEVHRLENAGDAITREALRHLFNGDGLTATHVIKWNDLYELLEGTLDHCESAAEIIEKISIKGAW